MTDKAYGDGDPIDRGRLRACLDHLRAASKLCEDAGLFVQWASLMAVADQIEAMTEVHPHDSD